MKEKYKYDESSIQSLDWKEHIRKRPGMYIGKLGDGTSHDDGIYILLKEIVDNSIDEFLMGFGKKIEIKVTENLVMVRDYGRGIPLGKVEDCVSKINTGAKYDSAAFQKSVGLNGVGSKAVNALSDFFKIQSIRENKTIVIEYSKGSLVNKGSIVATLEGKFKNILIGERVALNFASHISGIATKTNQFVKKAGKKTKICCTRKTIPNLRVIQKYAVKLGGGINHRFNLSDEFLIKDNHIASSKKFEEIIKKAIKSKKGKKITVEVDNLNQLKKIYGLKFDRILFDNMSSKNLREGVKLTKKLYETEASGGITLNNVRKIAGTGVDRISIGALTHSINSLDLKLEI